MCLDLHHNWGYVPQRYKAGYWGLGLVPLNKFKPFSDLYTDHSKAVLLLWTLLLFMFHVCLSLEAL